MRLLFDGYWWVEGPPSGRTVCQELVRAWLRVFPDDEVAVATRSADVGVVRKELPEQVAVHGLRLRPQGAAAALELPGLQRRTRADVVLSHNYTPVRGRAVTFLHDVLFQTNPEWFTLPERLYFSLMPVLARRASAVLTSSANEAKRIRDRNPAVGTIVPVGLAVRSELAAAVPFRPAGLAGIERFTLSVGRLNVRKNLAVALEAALQSGTIGVDEPLVVVGEPDGRSAALPAPARAAIEDGSIRFLGHVPDGELRWLYEHARLLLFLALDEGFGLPPLEALAFGTAVIASDIPVLRETLGGQATFVDPHDVAAVAAALRGFEAAAPGVTPAAYTSYTWEACVTRIRAAMTSGIE